MAAYGLTFVAAVVLVPTVVAAASAMVGDARGIVGYGVTSIVEHYGNRQDDLDSLIEEEQERLRIQREREEQRRREEEERKKKDDKSVNGTSNSEDAPGEAGTQGETAQQGTGTSGSYVVQPGDTLSYISKLVSVPVDMIADHNGIDDVNLISSGATLSLPERQPSDVLYVVKDGDTLSEIAMEWGADMDSVSSHNHIRDNDRIYADTVLWRAGK